MAATAASTAPSEAESISWRARLTSQRHAAAEKRRAERAKLFERPEGGDGAAERRGGDESALGFAPRYPHERATHAAHVRADHIRQTFPREPRNEADRQGGGAGGGGAGGGGAGGGGGSGAKDWKSEQQVKRAAAASVIRRSQEAAVAEARLVEQRSKNKECTY